MITSDVTTALQDPLVLERLQELHELGLPVVELSTFGKYAFVRASGEIGRRTLKVDADSPLKSYRNALFLACASARTILRELSVASEGGRDVAHLAHTAPTVTPNRGTGSRPNPLMPLG